MRVRSMVALLFGGLLPSIVAGQSLTIGEAARAVVARHPAAAGARAAVSRAQSGVEEAKAARLPAIGIDASLTRHQEPMIIAPLHGLDPLNPPQFDPTLMLGNIFASYTVFDGGVRGARIDRAQALASAAQAGEAGVQASLLADGVRAYLRVRSAREVQAAQARRVAALTSERDRAGQTFREGRAARLLLTRAEAALSSAAADATASRGEVEVAERELARLTGLEPDRIRRDSLRAVKLKVAAAPTVEESLRRARDSNPELLRLRRQVAAAEQGRVEARALWLPRLQVGGRFNQYGAGNGEAQGEWQSGVQVSYPLFTGGTRTAAAERAAAEIAAARSELATAELRVAESIDRAFLAFETARARQQALRAAVAQAEEVARIERLALDAGSGVQSDYITAEAELFRVRAALTEATYAQILARVELARVAGAITPEWINENLESGS
jgi:outer membrane protein TolC